MQRFILALCLALPTALYAQQGVGSASGMLSDRTYYIVFYRGPVDDATTDVLILLRGAPGWMRGNGGTGASSGRSSIGPPASGRPIRLSLNLGRVHFECSYLPNERILRLGGTDYPLDRANVVIIDRIDEVGGHATIDLPFMLRLPAYSTTSFVMELGRLPRLMAYLR